MLHNGHHVWLRSPISPYLHAEEDRASPCNRTARRRKRRSRCTYSTATSSTSFPTTLAAGTSRLWKVARSLGLAGTDRPPQRPARFRPGGGGGHHVAGRDVRDRGQRPAPGGSSQPSAGTSGTTAPSSTTRPWWFEAIPRRQAMPSLRGSPLVSSPCPLLGSSGIDPDRGSMFLEPMIA